MLGYIVFASFFLIVPLATWCIMKIMLLKKHGFLKDKSPTLKIGWRRNSLGAKQMVHYELKRMVANMCDRNIMKKKIIDKVMSNTEVRMGKNLGKNNPKNSKNIAGQAKLLPDLYWKLFLCRKHLILLDTVDLDMFKKRMTSVEYYKTIAYIMLHELAHRYLEEYSGDSDHTHSEKKMWDAVRYFDTF